METGSHNPAAKKGCMWYSVRGEVKNLIILSAARPREGGISI